MNIKKIYRHNCRNGLFSKLEEYATMCNIKIRRNLTILMHLSISQNGVLTWLSLKKVKHDCECKLAPEHNNNRNIHRYIIRSIKMSPSCIKLSGQCDLQTKWPVKHIHVLHICCLGITDISYLCSTREMGHLFAV